MISWLILFFLVCDFGEEVTNQLTSISDSFYEILWYQLPIDLQKYFILSILNAETSVHLEGFGLYSTRDTFKKVIISANIFSLNANFQLPNSFSFSRFSNRCIPSI